MVLFVIYVLYDWGSSNVVICCLWCVIKKLLMASFFVYVS